MDTIAESLDLLSWPTKAVNAVRALLADLNVPLPAVVAQALAFAVLLLLFVYLLRGARSGDSQLARLAHGVGALAAGVGGMAIAYAWVDAVVAPPSRQLVGSIEGTPMDVVRIELLDYRGEALAAAVDKDRDSGIFSISYAPEFADPPSAVMVTAAGCEGVRKIALRRPQLKQGMPIAIRLDCGTSG
jgi:hypothetical protein